MSIPKRREVQEAELQAAGQKLLDAAYAYWKLMQEAGQGGALFWLDDSAGKTVLFTRGEYRATLLRNVDQLRFEGGNSDGSAVGVKVSSYHLETATENGVERAEDRDLGDHTPLTGFNKG
jgi:hypothetical protein